MKIAFVFPGQGSQSVGMLDAWNGNAAVAGTVARASAALGQDLGSLIAQGPAEQLNLTTNTQPAMLTAGVAMYEAWRAAGGRQPDVMAGHSLGEYAALAAAQVLQLEDAVRLVRIRADAMQAAVPVGTGAMAAILGLDDDAVRAACAQASPGTRPRSNAPARPPKPRAPSARWCCPCPPRFIRACSNLPRRCSARPWRKPPCPCRRSPW
jgi:[acyl-carrier-protein] S-malonyltransferase